MVAMNRPRCGVPDFFIDDDDDDDDDDDTGEPERLNVIKIKFRHQTL